MSSEKDVTAPEPSGLNDDERARVWHLPLIVLVAVAAQAAVVARKDPLILEWRPSDLAAIALNYYRHGFDLLHPQILWGGAGPGYVEMEFPLLPYSVALLYRLFGVHDWIALVIPLLSGVALPLVVRLFAKRVFDPLAGLVAGLFAATAPAWIDMSTGLWPDAPPVLLGSLGLYLLVQWIEGGSPARFALSAASIALAILLKLTSLYLGIPVVFLFWMRYRGAWWRAWRTWLFASIVLLPAVCWYAHAYRLFLAYHNTFGIIGSGYLKFATADLLTSRGFYARTFARLALFHTTPLGLLLVLAGVVRPGRWPNQYLFHVWLGAVLLYLVVAAEGVSLGHYQYALPLISPCAALAGSGFVMLRGWLTSHRWLPEKWPTRTAAAIVALFIANAAAANGLYQWRGRSFSSQSAAKARTGRILARLTPADALIVVVDADMDDRTPQTSMTPPEVFYFSDRRGWYRAMSWLSIGAVEELRANGARYLAVSANHVRYFRTAYAPLYEELGRRYQVLIDNENGVVYQLAAPVARDDAR